MSIFLFGFAIEIFYGFAANVFGFIPIKLIAVVMEEASISMVI